MARVYLVDDHELIREALCGLLTANGHSVVGQSGDPTTAMAEVRELAPEVLLIDLRLGTRSGFELLTEIQRRSIKTRTIVTTMSAQPRDVADALRYGADGYILKEATGAELMRAITTVLSGQRFYEGKVAEMAVQGLTRPDDATAIESLSVRERQVIMLVVSGHSSVAIGAELHLSPKTVDSYRSRLMAKVGVRDVQGLVRFALRAGLISAEDL